MKLQKIFTRQSFNPTPYQGSIYTDDWGVVEGELSGFNPTPYQGSIYTQAISSGMMGIIVSIQLPIKGVFIPP